VAFSMDCSFINFLVCSSAFCVIRNSDSRHDNSSQQTSSGRCRKNLLKPDESSFNSLRLDYSILKRLPSPGFYRTNGL